MKKLFCFVLFYWLAVSAWALPFGSKWISVRGPVTAGDALRFVNRYQVEGVDLQGQIDAWFNPTNGITQGAADIRYQGKTCYIRLQFGQSNDGSPQSSQALLDFGIPLTNTNILFSSREISSGALTTLQQASTNYWGTEMIVGPVMDAIYPKAAICKYMWGAKGVYDFWAPGATNTVGYDGVISQYTNMVADLEALGYNTKLTEIVFTGGERDKFNTIGWEDNAFYENMTNMIQSMRSDLGEPTVKFTIPLVRNNGTIAGYSVQQQTYQVAETLPNIRLIDCDDLDINSDNIHYSSYGLVEKAKRELGISPRGDLQNRTDPVDSIETYRQLPQWTNALFWATFDNDYLLDKSPKSLLFKSSDVQHVKYNRLWQTGAHLEYPSENNTGKKVIYNDATLSTPTNGTFTIGFWISPTAPSATGVYNPILTYGEYGTDNGSWKMYYGPGTGDYKLTMLSWQAGAQNNIMANQTVTGWTEATNVWTHLAVVLRFDAGTYSAYLNGVNVKNGSMTAAPTVQYSTEFDLYVGCSEDGSVKTCKSKLDDVFIINGELSSAEISGLYSIESVRHSN